MANSNPDLNPSHEDLHLHFAEARHQLAVTERSDALTEQLSADWEAYRQRLLNGQETGASPISLLKIEAMASLRALAGFHCYMAHELIDGGMHDEAHHWAIDEGYLSSAYALLVQVDMESI
ncbi:MAG: hypothetical protein LW834_07915 [Cyanobium sp. 49614_E6]|jgi:hypothetical protein|nr:hypothetical protein [Cyanobium sp. 49614_E6]